MQTVVTRSYSVPRPHCDLWEPLVRFEQMPAWFVGVRNVDVTVSAGVPVRRIVRLWARITAIEQIDEWDPPHRFTYEVSNIPRVFRNGHAEISLHSEPYSTFINWSVRYSLAPSWLWPLNFVLRPLTGFVLAINLRRFARFAASEAGRRAK
jgi:Polyketide cyclase / dehydrase and lipid transport